MARLHLTFYINAFFLVSHVLHYIACQQCETDHYSIYQRMLQGYTFKALKMQSGSLECRQACLADIRCQSYNVVFKGICELNNRTKEARPENFVKDLGRYYKQRDFKRGKKQNELKHFFEADVKADVPFIKVWILFRL